MPRRTLSDIDECLLDLLEKDARTPVVALAKSIGLSRGAVQARLRRLEEDGVIAQYTIIREFVRPKPRAKSLFFIKVARYEPVISKIVDIPEVVALWGVAGPDTDIVVLVETSDTEALGDLRTKLKQFEGVVDITIAPVLKTHIERKLASRLCA